MTALPVSAFDPRTAPLSLRRDLVSAGYTDRALASLLRTGTWERPRRGAYVDGPGFRSLDARGRHILTARAALQQANVPVSLSHGSSLVWHGAPDYGLDLSLVDLTRHDGKAGRAEAGIRQHCGEIIEGDVLDDRGVSVMSPTRAALEVTTVADLTTSFVHLNYVLHHGLTTIEALKARYALMSTWPKTLHTEVALRLVRKEIESVGECLTFLICFRFSLPMPEPQYEVPDEHGRIVARLDFAWPKLGKWVEFDGRIKYEKLLKPGQRASDVVVQERRRELMVQRLTGWDSDRLIWDDLRREERTADRLRAFLEA